MGTTISEIKKEAISDGIGVLAFTGTVWTVDLALFRLMPRGLGKIGKALTIIGIYGISYTVGKIMYDKAHDAAYEAIDDIERSSGMIKAMLAGRNSDTSEDEEE